MRPLSGDGDQWGLDEVTVGDQLGLVEVAVDGRGLVGAG